nr:restriction endonuclease subunit S [Pseudoalteromonas sp. MMG007]
MQSGPFGSNLKHSEFQESGVLVLGIDNVKSGDFSLGSQNRISETKYKELEKYTARPGDLLVTVMASLGRSCVVPRELEKAIITKHVYRISMEQKLLLPEFYNLILQSHTISRTRMFENAQGQTRPGLNSTILRELPMPLCCIEEQKEIFNILGEKLSIVAKLEEEIDSNIERSSLLRQSILKKAFSGQLVSQDPNDEPASELLKKIEIEKAELAEKEKAEKAAARKSKSKAKSAAKK